MSNLQSKPASTAQAAASAAAAAATSSTSPLLARLRRNRNGAVAAVILLVLLRKQLAQILPGSSASSREKRARARTLSQQLLRIGKDQASEEEIEAALEKLYEPNSDGTRTLLVPHRGRISKVPIKPTKQATFDAHYEEFSKLPILSGMSKKGKQAAANAASSAPLSQKDKDQRALDEAKAIREQGGAAAASAKKVGVNKEFFRQLRCVSFACDRRVALAHTPHHPFYRAIFRILIPRWHCKESYIFMIHTCFLILRTYLSVLVARLDGAIVGNLVSANGKGFLRGLGLWFVLAVPSTYTNAMVRIILR